MAKSFGWIVFLVLSCLISENLAVDRQVIYNEEELTGSCTDTCDTIPDRTRQFQCERISHCSTSRTGWTKGFVRCDWCICWCTVSTTMNPPVIYKESQIIETEEDLYSTCTGTCEHNGLQSTERFDCDEVRDCRHHRNGWTKGFVRCDYCECTCRTKNVPSNYRVENFEYDLNGVSLDRKEQIVLASDVFRNNKDFPYKYETELGISYESTKRWEGSSTSSWSFEVGVSVSFPIKIFDFGANAALATNREEVYSWGESDTETLHKTVKISATLPPHEDVLIKVMGWKFTGRVPYTADQVIVYEDGQEQRERVSGYLNEASVFEFESSVGDIEVK